MSEEPLNVANYFARLANHLDDPEPTAWPPIALVPDSEGWTDEDWAAHDAKIAAAREAERAVYVRRDEGERLSRFRDKGWPVRSLESASAADKSKPAIARALAWKPQDESVLVLSGPPGCGKTTAAAVWGLAQSWAPTFLRATSFAASSRYDHEQRDGWLRSNALVLDDLGAEYADTKGNFLVDLDELVDTFYGDKRPLLITTNCDATAFKSRYGARIVDRIRECGSWFSISGESMRRKS